jgi:hypothetical protein
MSDKERRLPKAPNKAFGRKNNFEGQEEQASLLADRLAQAAAEGTLDEFMKKELPDNEYARNLVSMMMGMTGMVPGSMTGTVRPPEPAEEGAKQEPADPAWSPEVPDDIQTAIRGGDVQSLMELLRREHQKRNPDAGYNETVAEDAASRTQAASSQLQQPGIEKETIDALVRIAKENSVSLDWIILRAIKVYVQEYQKNGKL